MSVAKKQRRLRSIFWPPRRTIRSDKILTHRQDDAHQDHHQVNRLVWNTFRDHFVLEYEIPKWDGEWEGQISMCRSRQPSSSARWSCSHFGSQVEAVVRCRNLSLIVAIRRH